MTALQWIDPVRSLPTDDNDDSGPSLKAVKQLAGRWRELVESGAGPGDLPWDQDAAQQLCQTIVDGGDVESAACQLGRAGSGVYTESELRQHLRALTRACAEQHHPAPDLEWLVDQALGGYRDEAAVVRLGDLLEDPLTTLASLDGFAIRLWDATRRPGPPPVLLQLQVRDRSVAAQLAGVITLSHYLTQCPDIRCAAAQSRGAALAYTRTYRAAEQTARQLQSVAPHLDIALQTIPACGSATDFARWFTAITAC